MKKISLFLLLVIIFSSCESIIEIELENKEPTIVVKSLFAPFTPPYPQEFKFDITSSINILDTINSKINITNANVLLYENGILVETVAYIDTAGYYVSSIFPQTGNEYRLEVSAPNYPSINCSNIVPERVIIDTASVINYIGTDANGAPMAEITLSFSDNENEVNYYEISATSPGTLTGYFRLSANDDAITSESYYPSVLMFDRKNPAFLPFKDIKFNGTQKELKIIYTPPYSLYVSENNETRFIDSHLIEINLYSVSEDYYKYRATYLQHINNQNGDVLFGMNEPINVYSNIENGYGIFAAYQSHLVQLEVEGLQFQ